MRGQILIVTLFTQAAQLRINSNREPCYKSKVQNICLFCRSVHLRRVRRTLWQRCIYSRVYKCRCCGRFKGTRRFFSFGATAKERASGNSDSCELAAR